MALSTFVKINEITNLSDARYCSGMYVDLLGFNLSKENPRFIKPQQFSEITGWLSGIEFAAEFNNEPIELVEKLLSDYEGIQWVEHTNISVLDHLQTNGFKAILKLDITGIKSLKQEWLDSFSAKQILIHAVSKSEFLSPQERELIKILSQDNKLILGSGINPYNVDELIKELALEGIALNGGEEIKPGLKDFDELADILEKLEIED